MSPLNELVVGRAMVEVTPVLDIARLWMCRFRAATIFVVALVEGSNSTNLVTIGATCQKLVGLTTSPLVLYKTGLVPLP